jgi:heterodisulfide reductase subunit B
MKVSYYPGCSLHGTAREYDESTKAVAAALGVGLSELPDWNCCGASSAHATNENLAQALAARNLAIACEQGMNVVVPCAACYSRLKAAENAQVEGTAAVLRSRKAVKVLSLLDFFSAADFRDQMVGRAKRSLSGLRVVSYYGCLLVRPPKVTGADKYEFPETMERLVSALGAESLQWSYGTDCCGGSLTLSRTDVVLALTRRLLDNAIKAGAEAVVVACPLCHSNLDSRQRDLSGAAKKNYNLPILYFTELMGLALGHKDVHKWLKRHFASPLKLLQSKDLI